MIIRALQKVFRKPAYTMTALFVSASVFVFVVWFPNIQLILSIAGSSDIPLSSKLELSFSLLGSIVTNFTLLSATYTIAISVLFGMYIAMAIYFLRRRIKEVRQSGIATGFLGITSGIVGVGCAACGSFIVMSALTLVGAGGALTLLPLGGGEFGILGVVLLIIALRATAKQIDNPLVCNIK